MLVGLCAASTATPLAQETPFFSDPLEPIPHLSADLSIESVLLQSEKFDAPVWSDTSPPIVFDPVTGNAISDAPLSGSVEVREPGSLAAASVGLLILTLLAIYKLNYLEIRRHKAACAFTALW